MTGSSHRAIGPSGHRAGAWSFPRLGFFLFPFSFFLAVAWSAHGGPAARDDPIVGVLEEGKTYRRVDDHPISGKDLADYFVERDWEKELPAFVERVLVREEMERAGVSVADAEVDAELQRVVRDYARKEGLNPALFSLPEMVRRLRTSPEFLRDQTRTLLGFRKVLIQEGRLKPADQADSMQAKQVMNERLEALIRAKGVVTDGAKLASGEAVRVGSRGFARSEVRAFILQRVGPLLRSELQEAVKALTLQYLVARAVQADDKDKLEDEDRHFHFSYLARLLQAEQNVPDGREMLLRQLQQQGLSVERFIRDPAFTLDASLTYLARQALGEKDLRAEYQAHPQAYQRSEKLLAHIFMRVRDPQGRPYTPNWQAEGHPRVNAEVARAREERFQEARPRSERLIGLARGNFAEAAAKFSEDETTKGSAGLVGRVGPHSVLPPPFDAELIRQALLLKPGEVSGPLRSGYGWHLVKCLEKQDTTYEEARERVYLALLKRKREEIFNQLQAQAKTEDSF